MIVPDGLTLLLQPLDIYINQSFEVALNKVYTQWITDRGSVHIPSKKKIKGLDTGPSEYADKDVSLHLRPMEWRTWEHIPFAMVEKSLKKCVISTNFFLDETVDDVHKSSTDTDIESDGENC